MQRALSVYHLAVAKGTKVSCSLCNRPASLQCTGCRSDNYCCVEHQVTAWQAIHSEVCPLLAKLQTIGRGFHTLHEQNALTDKIKGIKSYIVHKSVVATYRHILEGRVVLSQPAAHQALDMANQIHGSYKPRTVTALVAVATSNIHRQQTSVAECYLSKAEWILTSSGYQDDTIQSELFGAWGDLAMTQNDYNKARWCIAESIHYISKVVGPRHVRCTLPLFRLGQVFLQLQKHLIVIIDVDKTNDMSEKYKLKELDFVMGHYILQNVPLLLEKVYRYFYTDTTRRQISGKAGGTLEKIEEITHGAKLLKQKLQELELKNK